MGQEIAKLVLQNPILELKGALVRSGSAFEGGDLGDVLKTKKIGITTTSNLSAIFEVCDAVIDFSSVALSLECGKMNVSHKKILVCGTTGFNDEERERLKSSGKDSVIIWSSNMSIGANLMIRMTEKVASMIHDEYDIDIIEMHHRNKVDSPSGTALSLGAAAAKGRGIDFIDAYNKGPFTGRREKNEIRFSSLRGGDVIGDHTVIFSSSGERIELSHKASNRSIFASGAIRAAIWGSGKMAGFYTMLDVLEHF